MRIGRLLSATALVTTAAVLLASPAMAVSPATLNPDHVGSTAAGFGSKSCTSPFPVLANSDGWHFVLPNSSGTDFVSMTLTFSAPVGVVGPITSISSAAPTTGPGWSGYFDNAGAMEKHAYVSTSPVGATLLGGTATILPDGAVGATFNLSHTCPGTGVNGSPSASASASTSASPPGGVLGSPSASGTATPTTAAPSGGAETGGGGSYGFSALGISALTFAGGAGVFLYLRRRRDNVA